MITNAYNLSYYENTFNNQAIDFDGAYGVQCADVRHYIEHLTGWACQSYIYRNYDGNGVYGNNGVLDGFKAFKAGQKSIVDKEGVDKNGNAFVIEIIEDKSKLMRGDIVFFDIAKPWGHVGIFVNYQFNGDIQLFDLNGKNPNAPRYGYSNYSPKNFVGAIRKVIMPVKDTYQEALDKLRKDPAWSVLDNDTKYSLEVNREFVTPISVMTQEIARLNQVNNINETTIDKLREKVAGLEEAEKQKMAHTGTVDYTIIQPTLPITKEQEEELRNEIREIKKMSTNSQNSIHVSKDVNDLSKNNDNLDVSVERVKKPFIPNNGVTSTVGSLLPAVSALLIGAGLLSVDDVNNLTQYLTPELIAGVGGILSTLWINIQRYKK